MFTAWRAIEGLPAGLAKHEKPKTQKKGTFDKGQALPARAGKTRRPVGGALIRPMGPFADRSPTRGRERIERGPGGLRSQGSFEKQRGLRASSAAHVDLLPAIWRAVVPFGGKYVGGAAPLVAGTEFCSGVIHRARRPAAAPPTSMRWP